MPEKENRLDEIYLLDGMLKKIENLFMKMFGIRLVIHPEENKQNDDMNIKENWVRNFNIDIIDIERKFWGFDIGMEMTKRTMSNWKRTNNSIAHQKVNYFRFRCWEIELSGVEDWISGQRD